MKYDGKLRYLFDGYIAPKYKTRKIDFDQKTMIDIAKSYHDKLCTTGEECIVFENKKPDARQIEFKVSAYTGIQFVSTKIWNTNVANFEAFPLIGGELAVTLPRITRLFSLVLDVSFSKFKIENRDRSVNIKLTEYSANVLSSRLGVRYSYPKYKLRPTIQVGAFYTNLMNAKCNLLQIDNHYTYRHDYPMPISYLGGYGEVGVEYKLRKNNFVFVRFLTQVNVFENYPGVLRPEGKYNWNMNQLKLGYTF